MDIFKLLSNGERVTLECKKPQEVYQVLFGTPTPLLQTHMVVPFSWGL